MLYQQHFRKKLLVVQLGLHYIFCVYLVSADHSVEGRPYYRVTVGAGQHYKDVNIDLSTMDYVTFDVTSTYGISIALVSDKHVYHRNCREIAIEVIAGQWSVR